MVVFMMQVNIGLRRTIEMTVINTPLKKLDELDEIPIPTVENRLRWAPMSVKLEYLRRSLMDLSKELKKEKE
jgi:hypothetical protein